MERWATLDAARSIVQGVEKTTSSSSWKTMIAAYALQGHNRKALQTYEKLRQDGTIQLDQHLFVRLLGSCASLRDEAEAERLHAHIVSHRLDSDLLVATALVSTYGKLGKLDTARKIFDGIERKDVACWNAMLSAYARSDSPSEALHLYARSMLQEQQEPNSLTYATLLAACARLKNLDQGEAVHANIMSGRFQTVTLVLNALVSMYASCGKLETAKMVFESIQSKNVVSWNSIIAACARHGTAREALDLYSRMARDARVEPDAVTFTTILGACSEMGEEALEDGRGIHARIRCSKDQLQTDNFLQVALINMYAKCGDMAAANLVFDGSLEKKNNIVLWNVMIVAYSRRGLSREALDLYNRLGVEGLEPDEVTVASALSSCSALGSLKRGHRILGTVPNKLRSSLLVQNAMVSLLAKCGELEAAQVAFDGIEHKNVVSWTGLIGGYAQHGQPQKALRLYRSMSLEGVQPNEVTLATVVGACSSEAFLRQGVQIHSSLADTDFQSVPVVDTAIITMYGNCGRAELARGVLEKHTGGCVAAWNAMIAVYTQNGRTDDALELYRKMIGEVDPDDRTFSSLLSACDLESGMRIHHTIQTTRKKPSPVVQTALLNMYGKCGSLTMARKIFDQIQHKDVISWNAMIAATAHVGDSSASLRFYCKMAGEGVKPEASTYVSVLGACSVSSDLKTGEFVHEHIVSSGLDSSAPVAVALINMYAKCGRVEFAGRVFDSLRDSCNSVAWNSMLSLYAHHGHGADALELFKEMVCRGIKIVEASVTSVLVGCSHSGLSRLGRSILINTVDDHGIAPEVDHFVCMVDLLARAGMLEDAENLILSMPFESPAAAWITLLGGCRDHGDFIRGLRAAQKVFQLEPRSTVPYNLLVVPFFKSEFY